MDRLTVKSIMMSCLLYTGISVADDVKLVGTISQAIHTPGAASMYARNAHNEQMLQLLAIKMNSDGERALQARLAQSAGTFAEATAQTQPAQQLGMNGVPVLNQGTHGTCVTFAVTAAMDAALNKQDGISQLCQLLLGSYLEKHGYASSGWNGSLASQVLAQMDTFGIVTKEKERSGVCAGLYEYPLVAADAPVENLSVDAYHHLSEELDSAPRWYSILSIAQFSRAVNTQVVLAHVKQAIKQGDRVVFGSIIAAPDLGLVGALGSHHVTNDTWVLTPKVKDALKNADLAGHEMVITGYDDQAVATDDEGTKHRGLLTLRNSWGANVGDQGDFYMSYDYFKTLVLEAHRIFS